MIIGILSVAIIWNFNKEQKENVLAIEQSYSKSIDLLKKHDYEKAERELKIFGDRSEQAKLKMSKPDEYLNEKYPDGKVLYYYAFAENMKNTPILSRESAYRGAESSLNKIPDDYDGQFAKEIQNLKRDVRATLTDYDNVHKNEKKYQDSHVYVGDSDIKVIQVLGNPIKKNRTVTGQRTVEQWVYSNGNYIYIENGRVTAFQN